MSRRADVKQLIADWMEGDDFKEHGAVRYKMVFFTLKFSATSATIGPVLRELGWKSATEWIKGKCHRYWMSPAYATFVKEEKPEAAKPLELQLLKDQVRSLTAQLKGVQKEQLDAHYVKTKILKLSEQPIGVPGWLVQAQPTKSSPGVPTLFASDWHWGEVVDPAQVAGANEYNLGIAQDRARRMVENAIDLLDNHMVNPQYPGIVFALGGDMVTGDIHEELTATNEAEIMPTVVDLFGVLSWCIETLANRFGRVFVPCVTGNHGRNTKKIRAKGRNFTSFDWLVYQFLAKRFANDTRVQFSIPDGSDCLFSIYGHRYLLTHGDQFRGGDGMIGALGPLIRGDHKKRSRNNQIDQGYDTMICGHWHQLIQLERLIVNGSLIGYNEYAYQGNFGFEPPRQALWITNPHHGITFSMPVLVEKGKRGETDMKWVEWSDYQREAA